MIYVMSDIHGSSTRFDSIMKQINLKSEDTLYILGDVVDRFYDGGRILRRIMKMPNVHMLLGNHEYMMLNAIDSLEASDVKPYNHEIRLWYHNGGDVTHKYLKHIRKDLRKEILDYVRGLPLNLDVQIGIQRYKLVHGSPMDNFPQGHKKSYDSLTEFAVWERWMPGDPVPEGYTMIFGHTPTPNLQDDEPWRIWRGENAIGIDCGCGYARGRLMCLRLDDMKEFYSEDRMRENDE